MTGSRSALALIFMGLLSLILNPYVAAASPSVYRVWVDDWYGFYQVREVNQTPFNYDRPNQTLYLNVSDTVIWINDASGNDELTIVSAQNLWSNQTGYLRYNDRYFNHTFTRPGRYEVYMKEYPRRPHQTLVVAGPEPTPTVTTPLPTPTATETATATIAPTPQAAPPAFNLMYILLALIVIVGIVILWFSFKK